MEFVVVVSAVLFLMLCGWMDAVLGRLDKINVSVMCLEEVDEDEEDEISDFENRIRVLESSLESAQDDLADTATIRNDLTERIHELQQNAMTGCGVVLQ